MRDEEMAVGNHAVALDSGRAGKKRGDIDNGE